MLEVYIWLGHWLADVGVEPRGVCHLDLTFYLALVTMNFKILSWLYLGNYKVYELNTWQNYWWESVGVQHHCVTLL